MGRPPRALSSRFAAMAFLVANLPACSTLPPAGRSMPAQSQATVPPSSAVVPAQSVAGVLLTQSRAAQVAGDYAAAAESIERALRVEPNNAALWLEYAELRQAEGDLVQAEALARKAASLAGNDRSMQNAADRLLAEIQRAR